jgi:hypothetical protein
MSTGSGKPHGKVDSEKLYGPDPDKKNNFQGNIHPNYRFKIFYDVIREVINKL